MIHFPSLPGQWEALPGSGRASTSRTSHPLKGGSAEGKYARAVGSGRVLPEGVAALPALAPRNLPSTSTPAAVAGGPCYGGPAVVYSPTSPDPSPLRRRVLDVEVTLGAADGVLTTAITLRADGSRRLGEPEATRDFADVFGVFHLQSDTSNRTRTLAPTKSRRISSAAEVPMLTPAPLPAPPPPPPPPRPRRRRLVDAPILLDRGIDPSAAPKSAYGARGAIAVVS